MQPVLSEIQRGVDAEPMVVRQRRCMSTDAWLPSDAPPGFLAADEPFVLSAADGSSRWLQVIAFAIAPTQVMSMQEER